METITTTIAQINDVNIIMIENDEQLIPIKPICELLRIADASQRTKIENDDILGSVGMLSISTGSDGKEYEMFCIPFMYVFGWLFTINSKNVKPEAKEYVIKYKIECYKTLYRYFTDTAKFLKQKQTALEDQMDKVDQVRADFKNTRAILDKEKRILDKIKSVTYEEWTANNRQLTFDFEEQNNSEKEDLS
jgi:hypothetical protein